MKKLIPLLILVVLTAGCIDLPDFLQSGMDTQTTELPPDIMVIQNSNVIPRPPVNAQDQFTVSFEIQNQDDLREVEDVMVQLYDYGLCNPLSGTPDWIVTQGIYTSTFADFAPDQTEFVEWTFQAPSSDQMGYLETTCPVRYKVSYEFTAASQIDTQVISSDRLKQLQRTGQTPNFTAKQVVGRGPVKIYFSYGASLPIRTSSDIDSILPIFITVQDKGSGILSDLEEGKLKFYVPDDFTVKTCGKFDCDNGVCTNNAIIPIIKKKSPQLRCSFVMPTNDTVSIERTYYISGNMTYTYDLTGEHEIKIKPILGL